MRTCVGLQPSHSGSHHAHEPAREALLLARPLILISTTDLPTQVGRLTCTKSTLAIHCVMAYPTVRRVRIFYIVGALHVGCALYTYGVPHREGCAQHGCVFTWQPRTKSSSRVSYSTRSPRSDTRTTARRPPRHICTVRILQGNVFYA